VSQVKFSLDTLDQFDGGLAKAIFDQAFAGVVRDVVSRPACTKPRHVLLDFEVTPSVEVEGVVDAKVAIKCQAKVPPARTRDLPLATNRAGQLWFNPFSPHNPAQRTIDEALDEEALGEEALGEEATVEDVDD